MKKKIVYCVLNSKGFLRHIFSSKKIANEYAERQTKQQTERHYVIRKEVEEKWDW